MQIVRTTPFIEDEPSHLTKRQAAKANRDQASTELAVFRYGLRTHAEAAMDRLDSEAVADASRTALEEELDLLDFGMGRAGQSAAKAAIVARHVEKLVSINDRRLTRRFG
jgi:hypothetical protein